jgi:hypothetical protein
MTDPGRQVAADLKPDVAKFHVTGAPDPEDLADVRTVRERLVWAIRFRETNQLQASLKAGLHPGHVNRILKRAEKNPKATIEIETANRLARALDVSLHWLQTGEGARYPYEPYLDSDDPFPNRQRAAWAHTLIGTDSRAIAEVVRADWGDTKDPAPKVWFKRIDLAEEKLLRGD